MVDFKRSLLKNPVVYKVKNLKKYPGNVRYEIQVGQEKANI